MDLHWIEENSFILGLGTWDFGLGLDRLDRILKDQIILKLHIEVLSNITPIDVIESLFPVILIHRELLDDLVPMKELDVPQNEGRDPIGIRPIIELDMAICQRNSLF